MVVSNQLQSLTAHYNNIDDQVERDAEDDENHVVD